MAPGGMENQIVREALPECHHHGPPPEDTVERGRLDHREAEIKQRFGCFVVRLEVVTPVSLGVDSAVPGVGADPFGIILRGLSPAAAGLPGLRQTVLAKRFDETGIDCLPGQIVHGGAARDGHIRTDRNNHTVFDHHGAALNRPRRRDHNAGVGKGFQRWCFRANTKLGGRLSKEERGSKQ